MKKLIMFLCFILFYSLCFAKEHSVTNYYHNDTGTAGPGRVIFGTVCIDGYKFAFMRSLGHNGVSMVQIFDNMDKFPYGPVPIKCKDKERR